MSHGRPSPQWQMILAMGPGDVKRIPHGDLYCVQQGRKKNSCAITKMVWRANQRYTDRVFRAKHVADGTVEVSCYPGTRKA